jgi:hypothetical protein
MGCDSSKPLPPGPDLAELRAALEAEKEKSVEQQNLLRFKVEVMVNMIAMEEKKNETATKRIETMKWAMLESGMSEQKLQQMLGNPDQTMQGAKPKPAAVDLSGAMSRTAAEFGKFRNDILYAFATEDGRLVNTLGTDEFMKQLYTVTEDLSKADIQVGRYDVPSCVSC